MQRQRQTPDATNTFLFQTSLMELKISSSPVSDFVGRLPRLLSLLENIKQK